MEMDHFKFWNLKIDKHMKTNPWKIASCVLGALLLMGAVGDLVDTLEINPTTGVLQNNIVVTTSNQIIVTASPTSSQHVLRQADITNSTMLDGRFWNMPLEASNAWLSGSLVVSNNVTTTSNLTVNINASVYGALTVSNATSLSNVNVSSTAVMQGLVTVSNQVNALTNNANVHLVLGVRGPSFVETNIANNVTNVSIYVDGIVTNRTTL